MAATEEELLQALLSLEGGASPAPSNGMHALEQLLTKEQDFGLSSRQQTGQLLSQLAPLLVAAVSGGGAERLGQGARGGLLADESFTTAAESENERRRKREQMLEMLGIKQQLSREAEEAKSRRKFEELPRELELRRQSNLEEFLDKLPHEKALAAAKATIRAENQEDVIEQRFDLATKQRNLKEEERQNIIIESLPQDVTPRTTSLGAVKLDPKRVQETVSVIPFYKNSVRAVDRLRKILEEEGTFSGKFTSEPQAIRKEAKDLTNELTSSISKMLSENSSLRAKWQQEFAKERIPVVAEFSLRGMTPFSNRPNIDKAERLKQSLDNFMSEALDVANLRSSRNLAVMMGEEPLPQPELTGEQALPQPTTSIIRDDIRREMQRRGKLP
jgi:hypothetical protein